ncbi:MAG: CHASE domain-containing protein [Candidatus Rokubacteria bacterium]|nr:CHASE domain-containing protein [Candidatus Rokubacteria bacterium]
MTEDRPEAVRATHREHGRWWRYDLPTHGHWWRHALLAVTVISGLLASLAAFAVVRQWERDHLAVDFERQAFRLAASIDRTTNEIVAVLHGHASLYQIGGHIDPAQFHALAAEVIGRHPGIQAVGWILRVPAAARAANEAARRADGFPRPEILERDSRGRMVRAGQRDEYFPLHSVEPLAGNEHALGFDLASEPARRAALEGARSTGAPEATARVTLLREHGALHGILVFVPVYAPGSLVDTPEQRRDGLRGFVLGVLNVGDLVDHALRHLDATGIEIEVSDEAAPAGERLLHRRNLDGGSARGMVADLAWRTPDDVAGRRWSLTFRPTGGYVTHSPWASWASLAAVLAFTALVSLAFAAAIRRAAELAAAKDGLEAEIAARERAYAALGESERRYRLLADNAKDVISVFDLDLRIVYVSPSIARLRGFTVEEALRQTIAERLTPASLEAVMDAHARALRASPDEPEWRTLELEMPCKDGSTVWVETILSFMNDDEGRRVGILSVSRDITERKRTAERMRALAEVGRALSQSLDPTAVGSLVVDSVCTLLGTRSAAIYRIDAERGEIVLQVTSTSRGSDFWWSQRLPLSASLGGVAVRERHSVAARDVLCDPRFGYTAEVRSLIEAARDRAVLAVPLQVQDRVFGVLTVGDRTGRAFTGSDVAVAEAFADQAAIALENARLFAEAEQRRRAAESLADLDRLISRSLDPDEVARRVAESLGALLSAQSSAVFQIDERSGGLRVLAAWGELERMYEPGFLMPRGIGMVGLAIREGLPVVTPDLLTDARVELPPEIRARLEPLANRAVLAVPLLVQGRVTGAVGVGDVEGRVYGAHDIRLVEAFAHQAALALENARLHSETATRLRHTQALLEVSQAVGSTLDPTEAFRRTVRVAVRALGADTGGIAALVPGRDGIVPLAGYRMPLEVLRQAPAAVPARLLLERLRSEGVIGSSDSQDDPSFREHPWARGVPHRSVLASPLRIKGEMVGLIAIVWIRERHDFTEDERGLIEGIARQAAIGIDNARLIEQLQTRQGRLEALLATSRELSRIQPLEDPAARGPARSHRGGVRSAARSAARGVPCRRRGRARPDRRARRRAAPGCGLDRAARDLRQPLRQDRPETLAHIFEPFFTTKEQGKGTGLGLAMVYGTVKQSAGNIYVDSGPGIGTTFTIYLPPADGSVETRVGPASPTATPGGTETILLVEDEDAVRELLREILADLGYTVLTAEDGDAALAICERHEGDLHLVLTDVVMPRLSGPELVRRLADLRRGLKVMYMSGYTDGAIAQHGALDPGTVFLEKPFSPPNVGRLVRQVLDGTSLGAGGELDRDGAPRR